MTKVERRAHRRIMRRWDRVMARARREFKHSSFLQQYYGSFDVYIRDINR